MSDVPDHKQTEQFAQALDNLIDRFRNEYDLTYASVIGVLVMKQKALCDEAEDATLDDG